jgi:hypothetical protein
MTTIPAAPLMLVTTAHPSLSEHPGPNGETVHPALGRLIQPRHTSSIEATAAAGIPWAADNDCFQGLDADAFTRMIGRLEGLDGCLFVTVPDVVGDAKATAAQFDRWAPELEARGLPVALVLQDGIDELGDWLEATWPRLAAVFVGGTDDFKLGPIAARLAAEAKDRGLWVHWGRVNTRRRMDHIAATGAADSFDGSSWAIFRKAVANKRTGERKLEQGLRWCAELAAAAAAALRDAPATVVVGGRALAPVAGGSPEVDAPTCIVVNSENTNRKDTMTETPSLSESLDQIRRADEARITTRRELKAKLEVLEAFDFARSIEGHDYGSGQRANELRRVRNDLEDVDRALRLRHADRPPQPTRAELAEAFNRLIVRGKVRRAVRDASTYWGRGRDHGKARVLRAAARARKNLELEAVRHIGAALLGASTEELLAAKPPVEEGGPVEVSPETLAESERIQRELERRGVGRAAR